MSRPARPWVRGFIDYGAIALFLGTLVVTHDLVKATWALVAGAVAAVAAGLIFERRVPPMALVTAAVAFVMGTMTLLLHDPRYIKMKPTIVYLGFAAFLLAGLIRRKNALRALMGDTFHLPEPVVRVLTVRYALCFLALAAANEVARRVLSNVGWGWSKIAMMVALFLFTLTQMPLILKHAPEAEAAPPKE
jgi:intracellular septation protein